MPSVPLRYRAVDELLRFLEGWQAVIAAAKRAGPGNLGPAGEDSA